MRAFKDGLGVLAVLLFVALTTGGVAITTQADPSLSADPEMQAAATAAESQGVCRAPLPNRRTRILPRPDGGEGQLIFTLNTRGYNYREPGSYAPPGPVTPDAVPAALNKSAAEDSK